MGAEGAKRRMGEGVRGVAVGGRHWSLSAIVKTLSWTETGSHFRVFDMVQKHLEQRQQRWQRRVWISLNLHVTREKLELKLETLGRHLSENR